MKKLAVFTPNLADSTSFYRVQLPLVRLRRKKEFEIGFPREVAWPTFADCDVAYFHRPSTKDHVEMIKMAKALNKKVWVDHDDDLMCVPVDNPFHHNFQKSVPYLEAGIQLADVVSVQCEELKERYLKFNPNIEVIPNAFDSETFGHLRVPHKANKIVLWRGSETHSKDMFTYKDQIIAAMKKNPDWTLIFLGAAPYFILDELPEMQTRVLEQMDIIRYLQLLSKINPAIMIVPLNDNPFNKIKSNIAALEGTVAGAAVLQPNWRNWPTNPESFVYSSPESFGQQLEFMMSHPEKIASSNARTYEHILEHQTLLVANKVRARILDNLWGK